MEQQTNMVTEVNKIIANTIITNRVIYLPDIGSIYVESRPAKLDSTGKVLSAPRNILRYSSNIHGASIVDVIAQKAKCSTEQAGEIYSRWYQRVSVDSVVTIEGVGIISDKRLKVESKIDRALNPEIVRSLAMKRRRNTAIWVVATLAAVVGVGVGITMFFGTDGTGKVELERPEVATVVEKEPQQVEQEPNSTADTIQMSQQQEIATDAKESIPSTNIAPSSNPRYRVVYGIFSVQSNVDRAIAKAKNLKSDVVCTVRQFGDNQMVSIFESDNIAECKAFIAANESIFPGVWVSKRKGE